MSQSTEEMRPSKMWRTLPTDLRVSASPSVLVRRAGCARAGGSRRADCRPAEVQAQERVRVVEREEGAAPGESGAACRICWPRGLLVSYHLAHQRPMMGAFLDALGIAHEEGLIKEESPKAPDAETLDRAVKTLSETLSQGRRRPLLLGAALAGSRDLGRTQGPARTGAGIVAPFERHLFICCNQRQPDHPRGCCDPDASDSLQKAFKKALAERGLNRRMRANRAGLSRSMRARAQRRHLSGRHLVWRGHTRRRGRNRRQP